MYRTIEDRGGYAYYEGKELGLFWCLTNSFGIPRCKRIRKIKVTVTEGGPFKLKLVGWGDDMYELFKNGVWGEELVCKSAIKLLFGKVDRRRTYSIKMEVMGE